MRLLIDTQIFIWAVIDSDHLSEHARQIMLDAAEVFVSAASIREIAILKFLCVLLASACPVKYEVHFTGAVNYPFALLSLEPFF